MKSVILVGMFFVPQSCLQDNIGIEEGGVLVVTNIFSDPTYCLSNADCPEDECCAHVSEHIGVCIPKEVTTCDLCEDTLVCQE